MDIFGLVFVISGLFFYVSAKETELVRRETLDGCPPLEPNCHPSCIVYTAEHCRLCRCAESVVGSWNTGYDTGSEAFNFGGDDWSSVRGSDSFTSGSGRSLDSYTGTSHEEVKYIIIEKQPDILPSGPLYPNTGGPFSMPGPAPYARPPGHMSQPFMAPGSHTVTSSESAGVSHVQLLAPGIPKYCVTGSILGCPRTCVRIDEWGCKSCPCAPARSQTMPVLTGKPTPAPHKQCMQTILCMTSCDHGYVLGDSGPDGCQSCTCVKTVQTTPAPAEKSCLDTLVCMLKCKHGYQLGSKQANGCPSCSCLKSSSSSSSSSSSFSSSFSSSSNNMLTGSRTETGTGMQPWTGSGEGGMTSSGITSSNNMLKSDNGVATGDCKPPMCMKEMSVDEAMKIGEKSANGGMSTGSSTSSGASGGSKNCHPPMCMSGDNQAGILDTGGLSGSDGSSISGSASGTVIGSSGAAKPFSPFASAMSGGMGTGGGGMALGASGKGMPSPFSTGGSMGGFGGGIGGGGGGGMVMGGAMGMGGAIGGGAKSSVMSAAYNTDCAGPECSAKNGMRHLDCPSLLHCMVTCDGDYLLGGLDDKGCQVCSCA